MALNWFNTREVTAAGTSLARYAAEALSAPPPRGKKHAQNGRSQIFQEFLKQVDHEARPLRLNFFKRAQLANSFKWRMLESGIEQQLVDELTRLLVVHLSTAKVTTPKAAEATTSKSSAEMRKVQELFAQGTALLEQHQYGKAIPVYEKILQIDPDIAVVLNHLATALCSTGKLKAAEGPLRRALELQPEFPEAHNNLGYVLRLLGRFDEAEKSIRRALKSKPSLLEAKSNLGLTLMPLGRAREAESLLQEVLKEKPEQREALIGMGHLAKLEGRFADAEAMFKRVLERERHAGALASLAALRKMTPADAEWLQSAEELAAAGIEATHEADLRFAIGKYYDDVGDYERAFRSYKRANDVVKIVSAPYKRDAHAAFVDDLIRIYSSEFVTQIKHGVSASNKPIFVVGMPRSGTSLVEQIIASHPTAAGAGELGFWTEVLFEYEAAVRHGTLDRRKQKELAASYLRVLDGSGGGARRVVDKAPVNADYLGLIHSVFPNARILYLQRDPIDTCLSCYFQYLTAGLSWTMDLADLAHYYRQHHRLMQHWRSVLPPGTLLDVPYEGLVADQEGWTRKILDFLGMEWDPRCLEFHQTQRPVATASAWQVRQKIYTGSVQRWRRYERHIAPLLGLAQIDS